VTIAYRGDELRIAETERVAMIAPGSPAPAPEKGQTGYWIEVRDEAGRLLFHRPLHDPLRRDAEVYSPIDRQSITRIPVADPHGEFEVLVPDAPAASVLHLYGPPAAAIADGVPAHELLRASFEALRRAAAARDGGGKGR
jgi:hypothetical protein